MQQSLDAKQVYSLVIYSRPIPPRNTSQQPIAPLKYCILPNEDRTPKILYTSRRTLSELSCTIEPKGAHFSLKQANDNTRRSGALCGKKSSHFLLFIAPKKPLVILQKRDHEINAHHPSYMDGAHARLKRIASEWCV